VRVFYAPLCRMRYDAAEPRLGDLERIEAMAGRYPTRARLLAELAVDPPAYTQDLAGPPLLDEEYLVLSTIHSAKGLEFDAVYVIHAADGNIPRTCRAAAPRRSTRSAGSSTSHAPGRVTG
jgi:DNA helicase II / ATP-dependent DNA helicase PcrA